MVVYTLQWEPHIILDPPFVAISYFSPMTGLYQKYVQEAICTELQKVKFMQQSRNVINHQKCMIYHSHAYTPLKYLEVETGCTYTPGFFVAVDPQTTNCQRTIIALNPPYHGIDPCQWAMTVH